MTSELKLDLVMTTSKQRPNVQLMSNPAVHKAERNFVDQLKQVCELYLVIIDYGIDRHCSDKGVQVCGYRITVQWTASHECALC